MHSFCGQLVAWVPADRFNHLSWIAVITPTGHPKWVRNRCIIEVFRGVFVLSLWFLFNSVRVRAFIIELGQFLFSSLISFFAVFFLIVNIYITGALCHTQSGSTILQTHGSHSSASSGSTARNLIRPSVNGYVHPSFDSPYFIQIHDRVVAYSARQPRNLSIFETGSDNSSWSMISPPSYDESTSDIPLDPPPSYVESNEWYLNEVLIIYWMICNSGLYWF